MFEGLFHGRYNLVLKIRYSSRRSFGVLSRRDYPGIRENTTGGSAGRMANLRGRFNLAA